MEVSGKIKVIGATQQVSASFQKRQLVITTEEQYPQFIEINFIQDKCDVLIGYKVGDTVTVGINLRGREWTNPQGETKYFNDIQGWKISKTENATVNEPVNEPVFETVTDLNEVENDLPF